MKKKYSELPNWVFELNEVSANVYEVVGTNQFGQKVYGKGLELNELIDKCKKNAEEIERSRGIKSSGSSL